MIRKILTYPDSRLKKKSLPMDKINRPLIDDLIDTMRNANGAGLAAPQIGVLKRILVVENHPDPMVIINPEIFWMSQETQTMVEGCLSIPGYSFEVTRPVKVSVSFTDQFGNAKSEMFEGLNSICLQHEIDHLNGVLIVDHLPLGKRRLIKKKIETHAAKQGEVAERSNATVC